MIHLHKSYKYLMVSALLLFILSCAEPPVPKPTGYFRLSFPKKTYELYAPPDCPYRFEIPSYMTVDKDTTMFSEPCWVNITMPQMKVKIHLSYKSVDGNLFELLEDSRTLAYKHTIKADAIPEQVYVDTAKNVYCRVYDIKGNAASPIQFHATDSSRHFVRGSLYFTVTPNKDSLAPAIQFFREDVRHLIETIEFVDRKEDTK